jgi:hypothetical protein
MSPVLMVLFFRGESKGQTGIFPASFVRIIDSFPGPTPPASADLSMYLNASSNNSARGNNDYMNTRYNKDTILLDLYENESFT